MAEETPKKEEIKPPEVKEVLKEEPKKEEVKEEEPKKEEVKIEKTPTGKIFTIPLRKAYRKSDKIRGRYAISLIRNYLMVHTKKDDIKIGEKLNHAIFERGMKKPPRKIRVQISEEGETIKAELIGHEYKEFKIKPKEESKGLTEKLQERLGPKALKKEEEAKKIEGNRDALAKSEAPVVSE